MNIDLTNFKTKVNFCSESTDECYQLHLEMLQAFMESEQTLLRFSSSLTGSERKCVHQVNLITNQSTLLVTIIINRFLKKLDFYM